MNTNNKSEFVWFQRPLLDEISFFQYSPEKDLSNDVICENLRTLCSKTMEEEEIPAYEDLIEGFPPIF